MNNLKYQFLRWLFSFWVKNLYRKYNGRMQKWISSQSNMNIAKQRLLKAKINYWKSSYDAWGWLIGCQFCFTGQEMKRHDKMMKNLFPDVYEWDVLR